MEDPDWVIEQIGTWIASIPDADGTASVLTRSHLMLAGTGGPPPTSGRNLLQVGSGA